MPPSARNSASVFIRKSTLITSDAEPSWGGSRRRRPSSLMQRMIEQVRNGEIEAGHLLRQAETRLCFWSGKATR
jgi:hypothetical protein